MNRKTAFATLLLSSLLVTIFPLAVAAESGAPALREYAWGFPILPEGNASFYSVELPLLVNQSVSDADLRDAGVYNAGGVPVPRVFHPTSNEVDESEHWSALAVIPLFAGSATTAEAVKLRFEREGGRTTLDFDSDGGAAGNDGSEQLTAYIVDTRPLKKDLEALQLRWRETSAGFIGRVMVDASNDLSSWREVGTGAVADLREADSEIVQRRVSLRRTGQDYLRIRWEALPKDWQLTAVEGGYSTDRSTVIRHLTVLEPSEVAGDGSYLYDLGGAPRVDRIRLLLTQPNTVVTASMHYWSDTRQDWVQFATGSHYQIGNDNAVVRSAAVSIYPVRIRRFKVQVIRGQPGAPPQLEAGWRPDTLTFLAQGQAPYTLAAGRAADAADQFPQQRLFADPTLIRLATGPRAASAGLGPRYALGGITDLAPVEIVDWRRLVLWIGLALGVAFVGVMAVRVLRDLRSE